MKRIHLPLACYFITTNVNIRFPFFQNRILCDLISQTIWEISGNKNTTIIGFKINPDHIHMIIQTGQTGNISGLLQSIKRITSCRINQILSYYHSENPYKKLTWSNSLTIFRDQFYKNSKIHEYPLFKWQKSFHDRLIRTPQQLHNSIQYLYKQEEKHSLAENYGLHIIKEIPSNIFFIDS